MLPDPMGLPAGQAPEKAPAPREGQPAARPYRAPQLLVLGKAVDLVRAGYGTHPDSKNSSVNRP